MLPKDRAESLRSAQPQHTQTMLDPHLAEPQHVVKYTDTAFRNAAVEWLIATDQVRGAAQTPIPSTYATVSPFVLSSIRSSRR